MREELRRSNFIGNKKGLYYLSDIILNGDKTDIESVKSQCAFNNNICIDVMAVLAFYEYIELIELTPRTIRTTEIGKEIIKKQSEFSIEVCKLCLTKMIEHSAILIESVKYNENDQSFYIPKQGFPLYAAALRNFLIEFDVIKEKTEGKYYIQNLFKNMFSDIVIQNQRKVTIEKLLVKLEKQREQGNLAEEYVLAFEKKRLSEHSLKNQIMRISDIDVSAGYDIVSFNDNSSFVIDRFIEVKSYTGSEHFFWSENEINTAKLKDNNYYLYLINIDRINEVTYIPNIIKVPYTTIVHSNEWIMEAASFKVQKII